MPREVWKTVEVKAEKTRVTKQKEEEKKKRKRKKRNEKKESRYQAWFTLGWKSTEWTCGTTLTLAYVLCYLSAIWSQLQIMRRSLRWE